MLLPMAGASGLVPKLESRCVVYSPGEGNTIQTSAPSFSQLRLTPKTWAALCKVSNELDEDSVIAVGAILSVSFAQSMAYMEDIVGFLGDGSSTYFGHKGIVGAFHSISDTVSEIAGLKVASGNTYAEITLQDFEDVAALLPAEFDQTAKWYVSKKFWHNVMRKLAASEGIANMFDILSGQKTRHFLGYAVEFVTAMPSAETNSQICAILGDLSAGAYLAQRKELTIQKSEDVYFANNQLGVRAIQRIDINVFGCGDKTNPGPIVGLITDAS
jgi:HK97 family phage major capsid protein